MMMNYLCQSGFCISTKCCRLMAMPYGMMWVHHFAHIVCKCSLVIIHTYVCAIFLDEAYEWPSVILFECIWEAQVLSTSMYVVAPLNISDNIIISDGGWKIGETRSLPSLVEFLYCELKVLRVWITKFNGLCGDYWLASVRTRTKVRRVWLLTWQWGYEIAPTVFGLGMIQRRYEIASDIPQCKWLW